MMLSSIQHSCHLKPSSLLLSAVPPHSISILFGRTTQQACWLPPLSREGKRIDGYRSRCYGGVTLMPASSDCETKFFRIAAPVGSVPDRRPGSPRWRSIVAAPTINRCPSCHASLHRILV